MGITAKPNDAPLTGSGAIENHGRFALP